jgi:cytochrome b subunit of formate dehydrogenase
MNKLYRYLAVVIALSFFSGIIFYKYDAVFNEEPSYRNDLLTSWFIALLCIFITYNILLFFKYVLGKKYNLFIQGLACILIDLIFIVLPVSGLAAWDLKGLALHLISIDSFCFVIPFVHALFSKMLKLPD